MFRTLESSFSVELLLQAQLHQCLAVQSFCFPEKANSVAYFLGFDFWWVGIQKVFCDPPYSTCSQHYWCIVNLFDLIPKGDNNH